MGGSPPHPVVSGGDPRPIPVDCGNCGLVVGVALVVVQELAPVQQLASASASPLAAVAARDSHAALAAREFVEHSGSNPVG